MDLMLYTTGRRSTGGRQEEVQEEGEKGTKRKKIYIFSEFICLMKMTV